MQVILLERIGRLGQMGDVVTVKDGYARNFLLPQGKALRATKANRERFESQRAQLEAHNLERKSEAEAVATKLDGQSFIIIRQAGESGQLYGSVSPRDIADAVSEGGFTIERRQVMLDRPIKSIGLHDIRIALHAEVTPHVAINVARSEDEAARQARGEEVTGKAMEAAEEDAEAARRAAEELFEEGAKADDLTEATEESEEEQPGA
jgi:large subunit ribosomal protein L9